MNNFHVGQKVIVKCPGSKMHGHVTHIVRLNVEGFDTEEKRHYTGHEVECTVSDVPRGLRPGFEPHELIPVDDGNEPSSWEDVEKHTGWSPLKVNA